MSALKFPVILPFCKQKPCFLYRVCSQAWVDNCSYCSSHILNRAHPPTAISKRFHMDEIDKNQAATVSTAMTHLKRNTTPSVIAGKKQKILYNIKSITTALPQKFAEIFYFLSAASKKIRFFQQDNAKPTKTHSESKDISRDKKNSLDKAVIQINQSIVSLYDTSCVKDMPPPPKKSQTYTVAESNEDEQQWEDVPKTIGPLFPILPSSDGKKKKAEARRAEKISRLSLESRTKSLVKSLKSAHSLMSKKSRTEDLCEHLIAHPECVWDATSEKVIPCLLQLLKTPDKMLEGLCYEALTLLGYCRPLSSPGIRILSIDGGGTRGLVAIEFFKALEKETNKKIHQLFDYVCGVSTGALLASMVCLYKIPLDQCEELYKECAKQMFTRNKVVGTTNLVLNHSFYDSQSWEGILKRQMGGYLLIEFARDPTVPKISAASTLTNAPQLTNFLFRNYNLPPGVTSQFPGSCKYKVWETIRASSSASGYFETFVLDGEVHEDGAMLNNNPTALAIHESRLLWPNENFHCIVSLGTGRYECKYAGTGKVSLKQKISTLLNSATDTEAVHQTLQDLLQPRTYFRFNPYLSEEFTLDEIRPDKIAQMQLDAQMYTRRNKYKLLTAAERLTEKRKPQQHFSDLVRKLAQNI